MLLVERLSAEDLASLDLARQAMALNELLAEAAIISRELRKARCSLADAKKEALLSARGANGVVSKAAVIDAQLIVQHLLDRAKMLHESRTILQTLLRVGSP